jgi:hypothetical protein
MVRFRSDTSKFSAIKALSLHLLGVMGRRVDMGNGMTLDADWEWDFPSLPFIENVQSRYFNSVPQAGQEFLGQ